MRKSALAVLVVLSLAAGAVAGDRGGAPAEPRREFPARASEVEAIRGLQAEARELDEARRRLEARAQLVLEEARERLKLERGVDLRYDLERRVFFIAEVASTVPATSSAAPVTSR